jgi:hypothetical protein
MNCQLHDFLFGLSYALKTTVAPVLLNFFHSGGYFLFTLYFSRLKEFILLQGVLNLQNCGFCKFNYACAGNRAA